MLAAFLYDSGELRAGALEERLQLALFLRVAMGGTGRRHEEPRDFCRRAAQGCLLCCWLMLAIPPAVARASVEERMVPIPMSHYAISKANSHMSRLAMTV